jgi:hypothetical protein
VTNLFTGGTLSFYEEAVPSVLIPPAIRFLEQETGRYFGPPKAFEEVCRGSGTTRLWLKERPIDEYVTVERRAVGGDWELVQEGWEVRGRALVRTDHHQWGRRFDFRVTYEAGYGSLPPDVEQAVADLVHARIGDAERDPGLKSESLGDYSWTRADSSIPDSVTRFVAQWRDHH